MVFLMHIQATFYEQSIFPGFFTDIIDYYSNAYDNHIVIGEFNLEPCQMYLETFMETHNYFNLVKNNTCFNGPGSCIDFILTNRIYCFQSTSSFETGLSDHITLFILYLKAHLRRKNLNKLSIVIISTFNGNTLKTT